jgi:hypothetical protein
MVFYHHVPVYLVSSDQDSRPVSILAYKRNSELCFMVFLTSTNKVTALTVIMNKLFTINYC